MRKYETGKYFDHKEEILKMRSEGISLTKIALSLSNKYEEDFDVQNVSRAIKAWNPTVVDETLHRGNLLDHNWKVAWIKDKETGVSALVSNSDYKEEVVDYELIRQEMINEMKQLSPFVDKIEVEDSNDNHCLIIDIADLHIGKLATKSGSNDTYNVDVAVKRARFGVASLLKRARAYNIDRIFFIIGNDVLHIDTPKRTTTSGTPQDTDGMWYDNFRIARMVYSDIISSLAKEANVHVIHCPSNHDYMSGFMLADALYCYFHNNQNITFDVSNLHRKYTTYGTNLLSFSHGDGAKLDQVPYLAAHEAPEEWAKTKYRYAYLHHIHHKDFWKFRSGKDFIGMTVEYLRSPSGTDRWHADNGYVGAKKAIEAFIHHPIYGQICRLTHNF